MVRDSRIRENPLTLDISHPTPIRPGGTIKQQQHPSTRSVYIPRPFGRVRTKNQGQEQIQNNPRPPIHQSTSPTLAQGTTLPRYDANTAQHHLQHQHCNFADTTTLHHLQQHPP
ncbi:hypothetical protein QL285_017456 [Trifolium repens]|nr:hypothetical protein QL285_017456 [Trifolium repens]